MLSRRLQVDNRQALYGTTNLDRLSGLPLRLLAGVVLSPRVSDLRSFNLPSFPPVSFRIGRTTQQLSRQGGLLSRRTPAILTNLELPA